MQKICAEYTKKKEEEISHLCQRNFNEYLGSVQQLLKMRSDVTELRGSLGGRCGVAALRRAAGGGRRAADWLLGGRWAVGRWLH